MPLKFLLFFLCSFYLSNAYTYQFPAEICDNGIDDDADGLIDLSDTLDCICTNFIETEPSSYFPNHSGESYLSLPTTFSQIYRATPWSQQGSSSCEYFNLIDGGYAGTSPNGNPNPSWIPEFPTNGSPDGLGFFGYIAGHGEGSFPKEYLTVCLNDDLVPGVAYTLNFKVGFGLENDFWENQDNQRHGASPEEFVLYGCHSCSCVYNGINSNANSGNHNRCPTLYEGDWIKVGSAIVTGYDEWVDVQTHFTIPYDEMVRGVVFGGNCEFGTGEIYYFVDDFILNESIEFNIPAIAVTEGNPCYQDAVLSANMDDVTYQWYKDGVAIVGATAADLPVMNGDFGVYSFVADNGVDCMESVPFDLSEEYYTNPVVILDTTLCYTEILTVNEIDYQTTGNYIDTIYARGFCDTIFFLNLTVNPAPIVSVDTFICFGDSVALGEEWLRETGYYTSVLSTYLECDSVVSINLTVEDEIQLDLFGEPIICEDEEGNGSTTYGVVSNFLNFLWSTGEQEYTVDINTAGNHAVTVSSDTGCEKVENFFIIANPIPEYEFSKVDISCPDKNDGSISISVFAGIEPFLYSFDGGISFQETPVKNNLGSGDYEVILKDNYDCEWVQTITIDAANSVDLSIYLENNYVLSPTEPLALDLSDLSDQTDSLVWSSDAVVDCTNCYEVELSAETSEDVSVTAFFGDNCSETFNFQVDVLISKDIYIPQAFSPNEDGINERFMVFGGSELANIRKMQIFNRHGNKIFEAEDFPPNSTDFGWDATYKGEWLPQGVYVYLLEVEFLDGTTEQFQGDVTVVR